MTDQDLSARIVRSARILNDAVAQAVAQGLRVEIGTYPERTIGLPNTVPVVVVALYREVLSQEGADDRATDQRP